MGLWDTVFINPMINGLIVLQRLLFGNFGLAIILFTILVRAATLPLTLRQLHSSRRMQALSPRIQEINKKHKDPKRRQEETMKLYREAGVNPIGCLGPMIIQFPIWIALYKVLTYTVAGTPERTAELAHRLYSWGFIQHALPLPTSFLWLDLGRSDRTFVLFALVFATTWLQTKLSLASNATATVGQSATQQQTNQMMLWMMPIMFAYFTLNVPSGLALYWVVTNTIGIVMNWFVYGWRDRPLRDIFLSGPGGSAPAKKGPRGPQPMPAPALVPDSGVGGGEPVERAVSRRSRQERDAARGTSKRAGATATRVTSTRTSDGSRGSKRKDGRGGGQ